MIPATVFPTTLRIRLRGWLFHHCTPAVYDMKLDSRSKQLPTAAVFKPVDVKDSGAKPSHEMTLGPQLIQAKRL